MSPALTDRIVILNTMQLVSGSHESFNDGACVMEAVSYVAGEPWSDHPSCACPVISAFLRSWNDSLPTDADRDRLLKPLVLQLIDTKATTDVEERRAYLALDWMIRVFTPKWLDLVPSLAPHANRLRNLEEIADLAGASAASANVRAAKDAARYAFRAAAWDADMVAAVSAAWNAAKAAAWEAAKAAAWDLAGDVAWDAARNAAMAASGSAASEAAGAFLKPTTEWLQRSALDLVARMIACSESTSDSEAT